MRKLEVEVEVDNEGNTSLDAKTFQWGKHHLVNKNPYCHVLMFLELDCFENLKFEDLKIYFETLFSTFHFQPHPSLGD